MRELVILRDRHCVFPWCGRDARTCDLDHLEPYDETRTTRPDPTRQPRAAVQATSPGQDLRPMALPPRPRRTRRHLHLDRPHGRTYTVGPDGTRATAPLRATADERGVHPRHLTASKPAPRRPGADELAGVAVHTQRQCRGQCAEPGAPASRGWAWHPRSEERAKRLVGRAAPGAADARTTSRNNPRLGPQQRTAQRTTTHGSARGGGREAGGRTMPSKIARSKSGRT